MTRVSTGDGSFRNDVMATAGFIIELALNKQMEIDVRETPEFYVNSGIKELPARLDLYTDGSRDACDLMLEQLALVKGALRDNVHDDIADVRMTVHDWQGAAAEGFKSYLGEVETAMENQLAFSDELAVVITANRELIRGVREDVARILENTIVALESLSDDGGSSIGTVLQVVGIFVAVFGAIPTGGSSLAFGAIVAGSAMQIVGTVVSAEATVGGGTPTEVIRSMFRALSELDSSVARLRYGLHYGLYELGEAAVRYRDALHPRLLTGTPEQPVPSINGTYTLDDFRPPP